MPMPVPPPGALVGTTNYGTLGSRDDGEFALCLRLQIIY